MADVLHQRVFAPEHHLPEADHLRAYWRGHEVTIKCDGVRRTTFPRSLVARQAEGSADFTATSCFAMVQAWLDANDPAPAEYGTTAFRHRMARVRYLSRHLWKVVAERAA